MLGGDQGISNCVALADGPFPLCRHSREGENPFGLGWKAKMDSRLRGNDDLADSRHGKNF
jgi:hypothetical protein